MAKTFNADMLQLARDLRGWTQTELAECAGVTQGFVSQVEKGDKDVSSEVLMKFAKTLSFPETFFCQRGQYTGIGISLVFYRKRMGASIGHLRKLQAEVAVRRLRVEQLLQELDIQARNVFQRLDIDEYDGKVERVTELVRASWGLPLGPVKSLVAAIESAGGIVFRFPFGTKDIDAVSQWPNGLPPLFFINEDAPPDRTRFSLAHELGHTIMHESVSDSMETEADRFASEFLMPAACIASSLDDITIPKAGQMKPYWGVSIAALIRRSRDLGRIDAERYSRLFRRLSSLGYRKSEPGFVRPERPTLFNKMLEAYRMSRGIPVPDLARLSHLHEADFLPRFMPDRPSLRLAE